MISLLIVIILELAVVISFKVYNMLAARHLSSTNKKVNQPAAIIETHKRGKILCEICGEILPFNATRTKDGHWACTLHRVVVFHDMIPACHLLRRFINYYRLIIS